MEATIIQFRRGRHTIHERHFILDVNAKDKKEAEKFIGKEVEFICEGKDKKVIKGKINAIHGNKGLIRAIFEKGLPGQAITKKVKVK
jgi:large subunit ribosomal protein L35Ae